LVGGLTITCSCAGGAAGGGGGGGGAPGPGGAAGAGAGSTATCSVVTVCSFVDLRLPSACAFARSRCTPSITSFCWARNASPSFSVQSIFSFIIVSTGGNETSDFTLSSQLWFLSASSSCP